METRGVGAGALPSAPARAIAARAFFKRMISLKLTASSARYLALLRMNERIREQPTERET